MRSDMHSGGNMKLIVTGCFDICALFKYGQRIAWINRHFCFESMREIDVKHVLDLIPLGGIIRV